ncbi:MAG TPA: response regulator [Pirellulales bacterium]|nr:response regulator [Pirellulales bacterium]
MTDRPCLAGFNVLLCEDSPDIQQLVTAILKRAGASVGVVADGQSAVDQILSAARVGNAFDVVLMDIHMPVLNGLDATRRVRDAGYHRPILAFTSLSSQWELSQCLEAGCDDHLRKPVERNELLAAVAHFARRARAGVPTVQPATAF